MAQSLFKESFQLLCDLSEIRGAVTATMSILNRQFLASTHHKGFLLLPTTSNDWTTVMPETMKVQLQLMIMCIVVLSDLKRRPVTLLDATHRAR